MDFKKLLKMFEAEPTVPKQGVVGSNLANISGGEFATRADRLNQAKVDAVLGSGYKAGRKNTNLALQQYYKQNPLQSQPVNNTSSAYAPTISDRANDVNVAGTGKPASGAPPVDSAGDGEGQDLAAMARQGTAMRTPAGSSGDYTVNADPDVAKVPFTPRNTTGYNASNVEYMYDKDGKPNPNYRSGEGDPAWVTMKDVNARAAEPPKVRLGEPNIIPPEYVNLPANIGSLSPQDAEREFNASRAGTGKELKSGQGFVGTGTNTTMMTGGGTPLRYDQSDAMMAYRQAHPMQSPPDSDTAEKWYAKEQERKAAAKARGDEFKKSKFNPVNWFKEDEEMSELRRLSGLPLNEKAVSKQQQKFMGMVHAMQKGDKVKGASPELKKAAKGMTKKAAKDFASTKHKDLPKRVDESVELVDESRETLKHIANRFKYETKMFMQSGHMEQDLFHALYDYYRDKGEMPYSVAKGDPQPWVEEHFYMDMGSGMSESATDLTELARLAGLREDSTTIGKDIGKMTKPTNPTLGTTIGKPTNPSTTPPTSPNINKSYPANVNTPKTPAATDIEPPSDKKPNPFDRETEITEEQPRSSGAAPSFAPRERERVVSPKVDKYDKDMEKAEKARRDIIDREHPDANTFGRKVGKVISEPIASIKSAWHGATDAWDHTMGNDTVPDPKPPVSVMKPNQWKGDRDNPALKENDELNQMRRIAGLKECGDMGMTRQQDSMNVSTNMSSDGTKNVTISAQGDKADELLGVLKLAGMKHDHHEEEPVAIVTTEEEVLDEGSSQRLLKKIGDSSAGAKIYKDMDWNEYIVKFVKDGKVLSDDSSYHTNDLEDAIHTATSEVNRMSSLDEEYANEPEEEYQSVDSIIHQGTDLNREKNQYAGKPRLGDNPMAESMMSAELEEMLESILVREEEKPTWLQRQPSKSQAEIAADWDRRMKTNPGEVEAEKPYRDPKTGKTVTPPRGATNPPPDSEFPPGDPRNMKPLTPKGKK